MTTVVISYRQPADAAWGGRLADQLRRVLVTDEVFIEDSATLAGALPPEAPLALVVIGPGWLDGRDVADDPVRVEVETLLARAAQVVPVLVGGQTMPARDDLPASLRPLAELPPVELSDDHFREDVDQLSLTLTAVGHAVRRREHQEAAERTQRRTTVAIFLALCLVGVFFPGVALVAMLMAVVGRHRIRRRGGTKGLALAHLGFGLALFCVGFNILFLIDQSGY